MHNNWWNSLHKIGFGAYRGGRKGANAITSLFKVLLVANCKDMTALNLISVISQAFNANADINNTNYIRQTNINNSDGLWQKNSKDSKVSKLLHWHRNYKLVIQICRCVVGKPTTCRRRPCPRSVGFTRRRATSLCEITFCTAVCGVWSCTIRYYGNITALWRCQISTFR